MSKPNQTNPKTLVRKVTTHKAGKSSLNGSRHHRRRPARTTESVRARLIKAGSIRPVGGGQ